MLVKLYGRTSESDTRYSPATCVGTHLEIVEGFPDKKHISTSYVERQNLTMRMGMRRFTRLTNAFSKKVENLQHALALHFMHYNFCRVHKTLGMTPAMAAGLVDHPWSVGEILSLVRGKRKIIERAFAPLMPLIGYTVNEFLPACWKFPFGGATPGGCLFICAS